MRDSPDSKNRPFFDVMETTVGNPLFARPELLFCPPIPKELVGVNPRTILGQQWWDRQRRQAYVKNRGCCWACGSREGPLEGHELYQYRPSQNTVAYLQCVALCPLCHQAVHLNLVNPKESIEAAIDYVAAWQHKQNMRIATSLRRRRELRALRLQVNPEDLPDVHLRFKPGVKWIVDGKEIS